MNGVRTGANLLLIFAIWVLLFSSRIVEAGQRGPLRIEDALGQLVLNGPISLSPDGVWVAYTLQDNRRRQSQEGEQYAVYTPTGAIVSVVGCDVWLTNVKSGESQNLTQGKGTSWWPVWSPDGKHLAFYSDRNGVANLWIWDRSTDSLRQASNIVAQPFVSQFLRWAPDSRRILVTVLPDGLTFSQVGDILMGERQMNQPKHVRADGPTVTVYGGSTSQPNPHMTSEDEGVANKYISDLALVDESSGQVNHVVRDTHLIKNYWISPDGEFVAYTRSKGQIANTEQYVYELMLVNIADGSTKSLAPDIYSLTGATVSWSPDSHSLAYTTEGPKAKGDCFIVSINGGRPQLLTESTHPSFGGDLRGPLWDPSGEYIYLITSEYWTGLAWIIHEVSSQKRQGCSKRLMNTGFADPVSPFGASIT